MDDTDDKMGCTPAASGASRQGQYLLPQSGLFWIWHRGVGNTYSKLSIRDSSAGSDLCMVEFQPIKMATKIRGRRANTILPIEDITILKHEMNIVRLRVLSGSLLDTICLPSECALSDLEAAMNIKTPWDNVSKHRLEIPSSRSKRIGDKLPELESRSTRARLHQVIPMLDSGDHAEKDSLETTIDHALNKISQALLPDSEAWGHLSDMKAWLQVLKGRQSKKTGGLEYKPSYILDAVQMSDKLKTLDEMGPVILEYLGLRPPCLMMMDLFASCNYIQVLNLWSDYIYKCKFWTPPQQSPMVWSLTQAM